MTGLRSLNNVRVVLSNQLPQPGQRDVVWRQQRSELDHHSLGIAQFCQSGTKDEGQLPFVIVPPQFRVGIFGQSVKRFQLFLSQPIQKAQIGHFRMRSHPGPHKFDCERESTQP